MNQNRTEENIKLDLSNLSKKKEDSKVLSKLLCLCLMDVINTTDPKDKS